MALVTADRSPQYNGILSSSVTGGSTWTDLYSGLFWDVLVTGNVPGGVGGTAGLRFTSIEIENLGSVAIVAIWSSTSAILAGKTGAEGVVIGAGSTFSTDVYPYSTVDPVDPSIIYGPRRLGIQRDPNLTFNQNGVGTGANVFNVRINAGFLGV